MKIIIIGAGKVGFTLAENLEKENHHITIIDKNPDVLEKVDEKLDVMCIRGNGASARTLLEAEVGSSDLLIAVTETDEVNMVSCLTAKKLGVRHTIARVRDPEYAQELSILREQLDLDFVINPEQAAAEEMARSISFSTANNVESFANDRVRMVELKVEPDMHIAGKKIRDIDRETNSTILIGAIIRDNGIIVPNGNTTIMESDIVCIIGKPSSVYNFCKTHGRHPQKIKNVMIVGGGRITYYLSKLLVDMGIKVKIIEINKERCFELSEALPNVLVINSDGTDEEVLLSENIDSMDCFVAATGMDEENLMASLIAGRAGVKKVITKVSRINYINIIKDLGLSSIICPKRITTNHILRYVRGQSIESVLKSVDGEAEILEFIVNDANKFINKPLGELRIGDNTIIATIVRKNEIIIPHGKDVIKKGDRIIVITKEKNQSSLNGLIDALGGGFQNELLNGIKKLGDIINM